MNDQKIDVDEGEGQVLSDSPSFNPLSTPEQSKVGQEKSGYQEMAHSDDELALPAESIHEDPQGDSELQAERENLPEDQEQPEELAISRHLEQQAENSVPESLSLESTEEASSVHYERAENLPSVNPEQEENLPSVNPEQAENFSSAKPTQVAEQIIPPPPEPHAFLDELASLKQKVVQPNEPRSLLYGIMFVQGLASLLPWNSVLILVFGFEPNYANQIILGFSFASFLFSLFVSFYGSRFSPSKKALLSILLVCAVSLGLTLMTGLSLMNLKSLQSHKDCGDGKKLDVLEWRFSWWFRSICAVLLLGMSLCGAVGNNGFFGMLPNFAGSGKLIQAYSNGQGISGFVTAIISYIVWINRSPIGKVIEERISVVKLTFWVLLIQILIPILGLFLYLGPFLWSPEYQEYSRTERTEQIDETDDTDDVERKRKSKQPAESKFSLFHRAFFVGLKYEVSVFLVLMITLIILNNSTIMSGTNSIGDNPVGIQKAYLMVGDENGTKMLYVAIPAIMLAFQLGDWLSRLLPLWAPLNINAPGAFLVCSIARWILVVWLGCRYTLCKHEINHWLLSWLKQDWLVLFMFLFTGLSNGYLCLLTMIHAPSACKDRRLAGALCTLMPLWLFFGIFIGSLVGFIFANYVLV